MRMPFAWPITSRLSKASSRPSTLSISCWTTSGGAAPSALFSILHSVRSRDTDDCPNFASATAVRQPVATSICPGTASGGPQEGAQGDGQLVRRGRPLRGVEGEPALGAELSASAQIRTLDAAVAGPYRHPG